MGFPLRPDDPCKFGDLAAHGVWPVNGPVRTEPAHVRFTAHTRRDSANGRAISVHFQD